METSVHWKVFSNVEGYQQYCEINSHCAFGFLSQYRTYSTVLMISSHSIEQYPMDWWYRCRVHKSIHCTAQTFARAFFSLIKLALGNFCHTQYDMIFKHKNIFEDPVNATLKNSVSSVVWEHENFRKPIVYWSNKTPVLNFLSCPLPTFKAKISERNAITVQQL